MKPTNEKVSYEESVLVNTINEMESEDILEIENSEAIQVLRQTLKMLKEEEKKRETP